MHTKQNFNLQNSNSSTNHNNPYLPTTPQNLKLRNSGEASKDMTHSPGKYSSSIGLGLSKGPLNQTNQQNHQHNLYSSPSLINKQIQSSTNQMTHQPHYSQSDNQGYLPTEENQENNLNNYQPYSLGIDNYSSENKTDELLNLNNNLVDSYNVNLLLNNKQTEINNKEAALEKLEIALEASKTKLYEKRIEYEKLKLDFELARKKIDQHERAQIQKSEETKQIITTLNMKEEDLAQIDKLVSNAEAKFKMFEEKNLALNSHNEELRQALINHKDLIITLQVKIDSMEQNEKQMLSTINNLNREISKLNKSHQEKMLSEAKQVNKVLLEREEELRNNYMKEYNKLNTSIDELKSENERLKLSVQEKELMNLAVEDKKSFLEIEIKQVNEKLGKEKEKNRKLSDELTSLVKDVEEQLQDKDKVINFNIDTFEKEEKKMNDRIAELEREALLLREENMKHSKNSDLLNDKHKDSASMMSEKENKIKSLKSQIESLSGELNGKKSEILERTEMHGLEIKGRDELVSKVEGERDELVRANLEMKQNLENADIEIRQINEALMAYEGQIGQELQQKNGLGAECQGLRKRVIQLEGVVKNVNSELLLQKGNLSKLKVKYNSKVEKMKLQLEESYYSRENLIMELTTLKEWASQANAQSRNNKKGNSNDSVLESGDGKKDSHKATIDNLKKIINSIDQKLTVQPPMKHPNVNSNIGESPLNISGINNQNNLNHINNNYQRNPILEDFAPVNDLYSYQGNISSINSKGGQSNMQPQPQSYGSYNQYSSNSPVTTYSKNRGAYNNSYNFNNKNRGNIGTNNSVIIDSSNQGYSNYMKDSRERLSANTYNNTAPNNYLNNSAMIGNNYSHLQNMNTTNNLTQMNSNENESYNMYDQNM
mmetsp:Transcript_27518/g.28644  ORF Transcript_27518/g.28644 Transcript_27518/m.28644 type:complete len:887 (+) Transcript_27518:12-2672(+)